MNKKELLKDIADWLGIILYCVFSLAFLGAWFYFVFYLIPVSVGNQFSIFSERISLIDKEILNMVQAVTALSLFASFAILLAMQQVENNIINIFSGVLTVIMVALFLLLLLFNVGIVNAVMLVVILFVYFVPTHIAASRNHNNYMAIYLTNLLLGWSVIGWIVSLIWSTTSNITNEIQNNRG